MKRSKLIQVLIWVFAAAPLVITAFFYPSLPAQIPTHWNLDGTVTYSARSQAWILAAVAPAVAVLLKLLPRIDPRKKNYGKFKSSYDFFFLVIMIFFLAVDLIMISESLYPGRISVGTVTTFGVGLLFIIVGNIMPRFKSNFFMGIKNPWTLSSQEVWSKTHRLGGILMFAAGIVIMLSPFVMSEKAMFAVMISTLAVSVLIPMVMSYVWYKRIEKSGGTDASDPE